ncbi:hypothetical protein [Reichenbachiella sp.]
MDEIFKELKKRNEEFLDKRSTKELTEAFEATLKIFIEKNYPDGLEQYSLFCSIHNSFDKGHNCVACNLNESNKRIEKFLLQYQSFNDVNLTFTNFIMLLYLEVECVHEYFDIFKIQEPYRLKHFSIFQEIKYWANFLKHPKAFMLVHHPIWAYSKMNYYEDQHEFKLIQNAIEANDVIDTQFVKKYYKGDNLNNKLYTELTKKEDVVVVFPNPIDLMSRFSDAQQKFVNVIEENEIVRDLLDDKATIKNHFWNEDEDN